MLWGPGGLVLKPTFPVQRSESAPPKARFAHFVRNIWPCRLQAERRRKPKSYDLPQASVARHSKKQCNTPSRPNEEPAESCRATIGQGARPHDPRSQSRADRMIRGQSGSGLAPYTCPTAGPSSRCREPRPRGLPRPPGWRVPRPFRALPHGPCTEHRPHGRRSWPEPHGPCTEHHRTTWQPSGRRERAARKLGMLGPDTGR